MAVLPPRRRINAPKKTPALPPADDQGEGGREHRRDFPAGAAASHPDPGEDARERRVALGSGKFVDSSVPIKWNPGVHKTVLHTPGAAGVPSPGPTGVPFKGSLETYMVPGDVTVKQRSGFRFHYNPTSYSMSYSMDASIVPNASDMFDGNMYAHQQTISLSLLLNRQAEMTETNPAALSAPCTQTDLVMFKKWGTIWDLDFLWAAINVSNLDMKTNPGVLPHDLGYLQVSLLLLTLGRYYKMPVLLTQMNITHTKFSADMVPVLTQVDMSLTRFSGAQASGENLLDTPAANDSTTNTGE